VIWTRQERGDSIRDIFVSCYRNESIPSLKEISE